jgi:CpeT protein
MHPSLRFAKTLAGHFSNQSQSQSDPSKFAHINIYFCPLPWELLQCPAFYSEQSYDYDPWRPYRQGIHRLVGEGDVHVVENYSFKSPERIAGAGRHPELLKSINPNGLTKRCGCAMHFREVAPEEYLGSVEPGRGCIVPRDGKKTYLVSEVRVNPKDWISRDRGFDPKTDAPLWGSEHGFLEFQRVRFLGSHLDKKWLNGLDSSQ